MWINAKSLIFMKKCYFIIFHQFGTQFSMLNAKRSYELYLIQQILPFWNQITPYFSFSMTLIFDNFSKMLN